VSDVTMPEDADTQPPAEDGSKRYLEYRGDPTYGTEFLVSHTITPAQAKEAGWETLPTEDMVWTRRESGRYKGRMLLDLADLPAGIEEELTTDPQFRVVTLSK
jgi:hypothetical protein